jgi:hypothetical protein
MRISSSSGFVAFLKVFFIEQVNYSKHSGTKSRYRYMLDLELKDMDSTTGGLKSDPDDR